jgi:hypothetical protein
MKKIAELYASDKFTFKVKIIHEGRYSISIYRDNGAIYRREGVFSEWIVDADSYGKAFRKWRDDQIKFHSEMAKELGLN